MLTPCGLVRKITDSGNPTRKRVPSSTEEEAPNSLGLLRSLGSVGLRIGPHTSCSDYQHPETTKATACPFTGWRWRTASLFRRRSTQARYCRTTGRTTLPHDWSDVHPKWMVTS